LNLYSDLFSPQDAKVQIPESFFFFLVGLGFELEAHMLAKQELYHSHHTSVQIPEGLEEIN
jgi:hypothetical protein